MRYADARMLSSHVLQALLSAAYLKRDALDEDINSGGVYVESAIPGIFGIEYEDYAVLIDSYTGATTVIQRSDAGKIDPDSLEARLRNEQVPDKHITAARQEAESLNQLDDILLSHEQSGADLDLRNYHRKNGYRADYRPQYRASSDAHAGAVAYTDGEKLIGVSKNFSQDIKEVQRQGGMHEWAAHEYIVAHEKRHMAQPKELLSNRSLSELDVETGLEDYFRLKARKVKDGYRKEQYLKIADYAMRRAEAHRSSMRASGYLSMDSARYG